MKDKAVFFATAGMVWCDDLSSGVPSATLSPGEWKALRLLTLAGYNIVLFTPEKTTVYADVQDVRLTDGGVIRSARPVAQRRDALRRRVRPLLQATATLQIDLTHSWMVGDRLDGIEAGRIVGCKTVLLTDGSERDWDMTATRWPDLIAGDLWEIACLIVMSDGSSVEGLSGSLEDDC